MIIYLVKNAEHIPIIVTTTFEELKEKLNTYCNSIDSLFFYNTDNRNEMNNYEGYFIYKVNHITSGVTTLEEKFYVYSMYLDLKNA